MQANRKIHLCQKKAHIYKLSRRKAPKNTANLRLQTYEKNQWTFLIILHGRRLSSRNNFANLGGGYKKGHDCVALIIHWKVVFMDLQATNAGLTTELMQFWKKVILKSCGTLQYTH